VLPANILFLPELTNPLLRKGSVFYIRFHLIPASLLQDRPMLLLVGPHRGGSLWSFLHVERKFSTCWKM